jgi:hypothetical protein
VGRKRGMEGRERKEEAEEGGGKTEAGLLPLVPASAVITQPTATLTPSAARIPTQPFISCGRGGGQRGKGKSGRRGQRGLVRFPRGFGWERGHGPDAGTAPQPIIAPILPLPNIQG